MDAVMLSRVQFALTIAIHFLFVPISIGLAYLLVIIEGIAWRTGNEVYERLARSVGKLFAITFAAGLATGLVMVLQFGTNWSEYSRFVGDVFGAPLAIEAVFAFFLESTFLGLYLFGRGRISRGLHWFSILMVAFGATLSAFWILVANSWQQTPFNPAPGSRQIVIKADAVPGAHPTPGAESARGATATPAGFTVKTDETGRRRAVLTDFGAAVFNPSTMARVHHTMAAAMVCGAFVLAAVGAFWLLRDPTCQVAAKALKVAIVWGLVWSVLEIMPFGHIHAQQVARTQPEKFAALEGLYDTQSYAPMIMFAVPGEAGVEPGKAPEPLLYLEIPAPVRGMLSWLAFGDPSAKIIGIKDFPRDEIPPLFITFASFHTMVALGTLFVAVMAWGAVQLARGRLAESHRYLKFLIKASPLPVIACFFGWICAEVGRQPWIVYRLLRTDEAFSPSVPAAEVAISLVLLGAVGLFVLGVYLVLIRREVRRGPIELTQVEEGLQ